jgi:cytochrome c553
LLPAAAVLVLLAGPADALDDSVKERASLCTSCHGEAGVSQTENTLSLAGQPDLFLQWQLVFFRSGSKIEVMQPIAEQLSNEDIRNLGAYFASLPPAAVTKPKESSQAEANAKIVAEPAVRHATPIHLPERRGRPASPGSARTISSKRYMTTNPAQDRAAASPP